MMVRFYGYGYITTVFFGLFSCLSGISKASHVLEAFSQEAARASGPFERFLAGKWREAIDEGCNAVKSRAGRSDSSYHFCF